MHVLWDRVQQKEREGMREQVRVKMVMVRRKINHALCAVKVAINP